jgi:hypothetical protein
MGAGPELCRQQRQVSDENPFSQPGGIVRVRVAQRLGERRDAGHEQLDVGLAGSHRSLPAGMGRRAAFEQRREFV